MPETPRFDSPVVRRYAAVDGAELRLSDLSATAKTIIRADLDTAAARTANVDFGASRSVGNVLVCGQRPGEWMLLGSADANRALIDSLDRTGHVSVIDHTHSRALFRLTGAASARALEKVCSLDWSDAMTPNGAVVSASVAGVNCDIIRNDIAPDDAAGAPSYLLACDRSFGQYLFDALLDAGDEFGIGVA